MHRVPNSFGECLKHKDVKCLHSLLHCLAHLLQDMKDDTARLEAHLANTGRLNERKCDLCGIHIVQDVIANMRDMVLHEISAKENG
jgi:hypothetical protein